MPLVVRYPEIINGGVTTSALCMNIDFAPTFLDIAGVTVPPDIQGASFKKILEGIVPADWREAVYYHYYEYPAEHSVRKHYGIRTADTKLIHFYDDIDEWEMYDLTADPKEMKNIYEDPSYSEKREHMHQLLEHTRKVYQDTNK